MAGYQFLQEKGTFTMKNPENYSDLYFPIAGEKGIKSSVTPNLSGDSKLDQNTFLLEPVSAWNLHNNRSGRNFWCHIPDAGNWSAVGASAEEESKKFTNEQDESEIQAGFMWHKMTRTSKRWQLKAEVLSFVPVGDNVEIMQVEIHNIGENDVTFVPTAAVPIYGRSADNIRDHRHVTSLLHRIDTTEYGVLVKPTLSFDERGHQKNEVTYFVCGMTEDGSAPMDFYPSAEDFIGEGGNYIRPRAVLENAKGIPAGTNLAGKEAVGGLHFAEVTLQRGESVSYTILLGAGSETEKIDNILTAYCKKEQVQQAFEATKQYWKEKVNVSFHTGNAAFDHYMGWVSFQPMLRRIYGCSFLPHHDYGKGGRGWRDLWQDCLALLLMNPDGVRQMLLDNFGGVRVDGTNATIIGEKQGEFIADRNNITRVWMDHGVWPFLTTKLYIDQTGDLAILNQKVPYFKDRQIKRGCSVDKEWNDSYGNLQKDVQGDVYYGSIIEHLLLQHLCAFYEVGEHNHIRMRGADWNDALDMAEQRGESVAFTNAYAGNLRDLADCLELYTKKTGSTQLELIEEIQILLTDNTAIYEDIQEKQGLLSKYTDSCKHNLNGRTVCIETTEIAKNLRKKSDWMMEHIRKSEWVDDGQGNSWFNGYYDNSGYQVEGAHENGVRMMLTSQVFSIMGGTATKEQVAEITKSADQYLYRKEVGGYQLNTDFHEIKTDLGRMFGFAYGEKENGAVFSHMTVMYANALYKRGFAKEGYKALQTLADTAMDFETSRIYPGIPEYFNANGRGMYHYLTGAASWYLLTMITEVFGVRGVAGDLCIEPKLMADQFDEAGNAQLDLIFAGKQLHICICNPQKKEYGSYRISKVLIDTAASKITESGAKFVIEREVLMTLDDTVHEIELTLE
ncbi:GH36-type glycosyl hydrolase domain-containing protein [Konateibacter massiliensis]|uniref:GH36-type glycosyl hydrolase domain-containing protein n=1 Tax=Konateibacter massiliensis TaxID=2002841 RepID=UPI000C145706|nr:cellobiose phosphorylase [Konateibacter massiliensis]